MGSVKLNKIVKKFGDVQTIHGVDIDIKDGEFVVFVGPSGCGKSTLLRMIAGLETITDGSLKINDKPMNHLQPSERGIAMVFQSYALYPHMTARENIAFSMKLAKIDQATIDRKVEMVSKALHLEDLIDRKPESMSGGQRQRIAIGRAIVRNPEVFLFDEPLSNLDAELRVKMRMEIARLHKELGSTMIYVTHDQVEAMTLADKIVVLRNGQVEQIGSPMDLYNNPTNKFVAGFIGSPKMNFIKTVVSSSNSNAVSLKLADDQIVSVPVDGSSLTVGEEICIGIRPEHLSVSSDGHMSFTVTHNNVENLGGNSFIYSDFYGDNVSMEIKGYFESSEDKTTVTTSVECIHVFDGEGNALPRVNRK